MFNITKTKIYAIALFAIACTGFIGCKEKTILGTDVIPTVDNINTFFTDTVTMLTRNITLDSFNTSIDNGQNRFYALGVISGNSVGDDVVGKTVAGMALQFRQPQSALLLPQDSVALDSLILSIPYLRTYGDTTLPILQTFDVYRLDDPLIDTVNYYTNDMLPIDWNDKLGSVTLNLSKMDSAVVKTGKLAPQLRVNLSAALASEIYKLDSANYKTYSNFIKWLRGIAIIPADTNKGTMIGYFDQTAAKLELFTHSTKVNSKDSITYSFPNDNRYCQGYNYISRNFTDNNPLIKNYINSGNTAGDSLLFLQGDFGSTIELTFPYLGHMSNVIVNKAEFEFSIIPSMDPKKDSLYRPVSFIKAYGIDDNNKDYVLLRDYYIDANGNAAKLISDGFRKEEIVNGVRVLKYKISLTRTIQEAISSKKTNLKIRIQGNNGLLASGRSVVGGAKKSSNNAKFNLIYTKIK